MIVKCCYKIVFKHYWILNQEKQIPNKDEKSETFLLYLGVVRKLCHAKNDFFDPPPPLSQIFQRNKKFVFGLSQILLPPNPLKRDVICERPLGRNIKK